MPRLVGRQTQHERGYPKRGSSHPGEHEFVRTRRVVCTSHRDPALCPFTDQPTDDGNPDQWNGAPENEVHGPPPGSVDQRLRIRPRDGASPRGVARWYRDSRTADERQGVEPTADLQMWRLLKSWLRSSSGRSVEVGTASDLPLHLRRLKEAPQGAFLIVEVGGLDDAFLQFSAGPGVIQMDHPLITKLQAAREQEFRVACAAIGRVPYESPASDGSRFLDCDLPDDPLAAAADVRRVLEVLFRVQLSTPLNFVGEGLSS
jgi:hypothetical protein